MKARYLFALLVVLLLVGCAKETPKETNTADKTAPADTGAAAEAAKEAPAEAEISVMEQEFDPAVVTIKVGGTVTWTNNAGRTQLIGGPRKLFSAKLADGESFSYTFEEAGEYKVTNTVPIAFAGTVIVE